MGAVHDASATYYGDIILNKIRSADSEFKQVFSPSIVRIGDWDWPRPDFVCYDEENQATYALEFKPPFQSKREYLTGLGQALSYLQKHTYSGLVVPFLADDGFRIADFISNTLSADEFSNISTSLYAYDYNTQIINVLHPISATRDNTISIITPETKTFWGWWRDLSHYEVYDLLNLSFIYSDYPGDIYTKYIFPEFYNMLINKRTRGWDGKPRVKNNTSATKRAEKQNSKIPLDQLGLWSNSEGRLTDLGFELLEIGKKYGPNSKRFLDRLTYLILVNGKHLDLINIFDKYQKTHAVSGTSREHVLALEKYLTDSGCIGKRKPTAVKTDAKGSYLRDEMKIWNKLGLLEKRNRFTYFFPYIGYKFKLDKISDVLISGT